MSMTFLKGQLSKMIDPGANMRLFGEHTAALKVAGKVSPTFLDLSFLKVRNQGRALQGACYMIGSACKLLSRPDSQMHSY